MTRERASQFFQIVFFFTAFSFKSWSKPFSTIPPSWLWNWSHHRSSWTETIHHYSLLPLSPYWAAMNTPSPRSFCFLRESGRGYKTVSLCFEMIHSFRFFLLLFSEAANPFQKRRGSDSATRNRKLYYIQSSQFYACHFVHEWQPWTRIYFHPSSLLSTDSSWIGTGLPETSGVKDRHLTTFFSAPIPRYIMCGTY